MKVAQCTPPGTSIPGIQQITIIIIIILLLVLLYHMHGSIIDQLTQCDKWGPSLGLPANKTIIRLFASAALGANSDGAGAQ